MADRKVIAVVGATGAPGGGLVRALLAEPAGEFAVRAITRDPASDKARALARAGAEVVAADLYDPASVERAFAGAFGAYCVTFFWAHFSPEREMAEAKTMAEAAAKAGLQHVIWSTLEDSRLSIPLDDDRMPTLMGRYKVPHFDAKGESNRFFTEAGVPTTFLLTSFYWDNFIHFGAGPQRGPDGRLALVLPMADRPLPGIAAEDIGRCALGIFKAGPRYRGRTVGIAGEHLTGAQMAEKLGRALGEAVHYQAVAPAVYRGFGFPGADDLANMYQFNAEFSDEFCATRPIALSRELNPALQTLDEWLAAHASQIPIH
jgi:uncharacterized protein YbjT (DUF2867 family)